MIHFKYSFIWDYLSVSQSHSQKVSNQKKQFVAATNETKKRNRWNESTGKQDEKRISKAKARNYVNPTCWWFG